MLPPRVLLIDDDPLYTRRAQASLQNCVDLRIETCSTRAIATARCWAPQVIVVDMFLADCDCFVLLEELRSRVESPARSVIYLSQGPGAETRFRRDEHGFLAVVHRDAGTDGLRDAVALAIDACGGRCCSAA